MVSDSFAGGGEKGWEKQNDGGGGAEGGGGSEGGTRGEGARSATISARPSSVSAIVPTNDDSK